MKRDGDIERLLRRYSHEPGSEVKRSVLDRFAKVFPDESPRARAVGFWRRPVPLYAAVGSLIVAFSLSFFAGHWAATHVKPEHVDSRRPAVPTSGVTWETAVSDVL